MFSNFDSLLPAADDPPLDIVRSVEPPPPDYASTEIQIVAAETRREHPSWTPSQEVPSEDMPTPARRQRVGASLAALRSSREQAAVSSVSAVEAYRAREAEALRNHKPPWGPWDAALEGSGADSFGEWFEGTLPEGAGTLKEYIEETLEQKSVRIGVELGGIGSTLFRGFSDGFFARTAGVNLTDLRRSTYEGFYMRRDRAINHKVIEGNILDPPTHERVAEWIGPAGADLIMERMLGGSGSLPNDPYALSKQAEFWYGKLATGGLMFAQLPEALGYHAEEWKSHVQANNPGLGVQLGSMDGKTLVRIHKTAEAPAALPLLGAAVILRRELKRRGL